MNKICLIGASGFIGTRLIEILKQRDHVMLNIDKKNSFFYPEITVIADVRDKNKIKLLLEGQDIVILLAAEHRDDVRPISEYYDVNVQGARNVVEAMDECGVNRIIFTSSVAVYGLNKQSPNETCPTDPFNNYGKSKWLAEEVLREWYNRDPPNRSLNIIRPTVVFGERNRGNVYNLLKQISSGRFFMVGKGENIKSMSYVANVVAFIDFLIQKNDMEYQVYNYVDKPDFTMNELVKLVSRVLCKHIPTFHIPYWLGMLGGFGFDVLAFITRKKLAISSVRVKKFCATTQFDGSKTSEFFSAPYTLSEGLNKTLHCEFIDQKNDEVIFFSE